MEAQAYIGDTAFPIPDHHSKAGITVKQLTQTYWLASAYKSYVYPMPKSTKCVILCLKGQCTYLKSKILLFFKIPFSDDAELPSVFYLKMQYLKLKTQ